ncbi:MAG: TlyA family RNA methyltransferase [Bdellovibrionales bacterium]|nr:TlyA family RNA methyltransferase [Bdellovibrionales bacterium]
MVAKVKRRLDEAVLQAGFASTRSKAQALILAGKILVNDVPATKAGVTVKPDSVIRLRGEDHPYVSRGALKLNKALDTFLIDPRGKLCIDVGASTGGFTEVLLERGARHVIALDVGHDQMAWKIRSDTRVTCLEGINARLAALADIGGERPELAVMDLSFISLLKVLPAIRGILTPFGDLVTLIKPQFEVGREWVGKGGIVKDQKAIDDMLVAVRSGGRALGYGCLSLIESPILGAHGNREYLAHWRNGS